jgi:hypothetical protein
LGAKLKNFEAKDLFKKDIKLEGLNLVEDKGEIESFIVN